MLLVGILKQNINKLGKILWVRSLLNHLKHFIDHFENEDCLKGRKEYRSVDV